MADDSACPRPECVCADCGLQLIKAFLDGQSSGDIRPSFKRALAYSVDDESLSDAAFREVVRRALKGPLHD